MSKKLPAALTADRSMTGTHLAPSPVTTYDRKGEQREQTSAFATSKPGEPLAEVQHRLTANDFYGHTRGMELVPDRDWVMIDSADRA
jgi:hypothetical protein